MPNDEGGGQQIENYSLFTRPKYNFSFSAGLEKSKVGNFSLDAGIKHFWHGTGKCPIQILSIWKYVNVMIEEL